MTLVPGLFSHTLATTFSDARRDIEGMFARDVNGKLRAGIIYNSPAQLITARPDMRLNIGDFRAVQDRGGAVPFANQGEAITPAFDAAPSANRRIDTLIVTQEIPELGDAGSAPIFEIIKGNPSATPIAPPLPANRSDALIMCDVEIPAGATSMQSAGIIITPRFLYTAMAGGTVYVRNSVEMAAWDAADGAHAFNLSDTSEYKRAAGAWEVVRRRFDSGSFSTAAAVTAQWENFFVDGDWVETEIALTGVSGGNTFLGYLTRTAYRPTRAQPYPVGISTGAGLASVATGTVRIRESSHANAGECWYFGPASPAAVFLNVRFLWR